MARPRVVRVVVVVDPPRRRRCLIQLGSLWTSNFTPLYSHTLADKQSYPSFRIDHLHVPCAWTLRSVPCRSPACRVHRPARVYVCSAHRPTAAEEEVVGAHARRWRPSRSVRWAVAARRRRAPRTPSTASTSQASSHTHECRRQKHGSRAGRLLLPEEVRQRRLLRRLGHHRPLVRQLRPRVLAHAGPTAKFPVSVERLDVIVHVAGRRECRQVGA